MVQSCIKLRKEDVDGTYHYDCWLRNYGIDDLPLGIYKFLKTQDKVYARTLDHPVIESLQDELTFQSFDHVYEAHDQFEDVYNDIVAQLVEAANEKILSMRFRVILELLRQLQ